MDSGKIRKRKKIIIVQRKPLDRLPRKNIPDITDAAIGIREALQKAWETIDKLPTEEREKSVETTGGGKNRQEFISHRWFLELPESHILHPTNTRSVPVRIKDAVPFAVRRKGASGEKVLHHFDREEYWGEVAVWEINGERVFSRRRPPFYVNADNPQEWENGNAPPSESKILWRIRRGMLVRIDDEDGVWRVCTLEATGVTLDAKDDIAHAALRAAKSQKKKTYKKTKIYKKLRPV